MFKESDGYLHPIAKNVEEVPQFIKKFYLFKNNELQVTGVENNLCKRSKTVGGAASI